MNCNKGEMAFIVHSEAGNEGKIVTCIEIAATDSPDGEWWTVDRQLNTTIGDTMNTVPDAWLRPIRGDVEDRDEPMLVLAPSGAGESK